MFQNDVTYNFVDIDSDNPDLREMILKLVESHESESIAAPYFFVDELDDLKAEIPAGWSLTVDESSFVEEDKIRITAYHKYDEACRQFDPDIDRALLKGESIGGGMIALTTVDSSSDEIQLLELDSAWGDSPVMLCVTPGVSYEEDYQEFSLKNIDSVIEFIEGLGENEEWFSPEEVLGLTRANPPLQGAELIAYMQSSGDKPQHILCYEAGYVDEGEDGKWTPDFASLMMNMI